MTDTSFESKTWLPVKEFHPLSQLVPESPREDILALSHDIQHRGQRDSIVLYEDKILDGRSRYEALQLIEARTERWDKKPRFRTFDPQTEGSPLDFVLSGHLHRRSLSQSQKAILGAELVELLDPAAETPVSRGRVHLCTDILRTKQLTQHQVAESLGCSRQLLHEACRVVRDAHDKVITKIEEGSLSVGAAYDALVQGDRVATGVEAEKPKKAPPWSKGPITEPGVYWHYSPTEGVQPRIVWDEQGPGLVYDAYGEATPSTPASRLTEGPGLIIGPLKPPAEPER